jgi:hypothetical protein
MATFTQLPPLLTPQLATTPLARDAAEASETAPVQVLTITAPAGDATLQLKIGPAPAGLAILDLTITDLPGADPQARQRVNLRSGDGQILDGKLTDQNGQATFQDLPAGQYLLEVRVEAQSWELPVDLSPG